MVESNALNDYMLLRSENTESMMQVADMMKLIRAQGMTIVQEWAEKEPSVLSETVLRNDHDYLRALLEVLMIKEQQMPFMTMDSRLNLYSHQEQTIALEQWGNGQVGSVSVEYLYRNGKLFQARVSLSEKNNDIKQAICVYQPDGTMWQEAWQRPKNHFPQGLQSCQQMYVGEAAIRVATEEQARAKQAHHAAQHESIESFHRPSSYVEYKNLPQLMPQGMTENSLTVGYDESGQVEHVFWGFGAGHESHSQNYYLKNGKVYLAESNTYIPAAKSGKKEDDLAEQTWTFDEQGERIDERLGFNKRMPKYPLNEQTMMYDIQRFIQAAEQGGAKRQYRR